jgi:hypothetical protein
MKAHCIKDGSFKGIVTSMTEYEKLKNGEVDWPENVAGNMDRVTIPYGLFKRLMALDKAVEDACKKEREEAVDNG